MRCLCPFYKVYVRSRDRTSARRWTSRGYFVAVPLGRLGYKCLGNCLSAIGGSDRPGQFEGGDSRQGGAGHGLQIAVHTLRAVDDLADFLLLPRPLRLEPALLPLDIVQQVREPFD